MNVQQVKLIFIILVLNPCLTRAADNESQLMQQNPDWHITSEMFSNAPYWLIPTNVPFRLAPLSNGKWVWTTNINAPLIDNGGLRILVDNAREQQIKLEWQKQRQQVSDETDPPGIAHVLEYHARGWNQKHVWDTNMVENWWGMWVEDTNTGWRMNLCPIRSNAVDEAVIIKVGSIVTNSGVGLLPSPDGKYAKLELTDSNGTVVPTRTGAATKLYNVKYAVTPVNEKQFVNRHPPSGDDATVVRNYPDAISDLEYPRWYVGGNPLARGAFIQPAGFVSNGPPCHIGFIRFNDIFSIKAPGDYTLTVQPVLYRMHYDGGTFQGYLDRVDLPCATTKVHLDPNVK
jgi:hypothetical protein